MARRWRDRWLAALPAVVLSAVAAWQIHLTRTEYLSPWKGGGFGMFSTTDGTANRRVRVYLRRGPFAEEVAVPPALEREAESASLLPTPERLERLGRRVVRELSPAAGAVSSVRVEAWRRGYGPDLEPHPRLLRHVEVALGDDAG